jgi:hypothetical protein
VARSGLIFSTFAAHFSKRTINPAQAFSSRMRGIVALQRSGYFD